MYLCGYILCKCEFLSAGKAVQKQVRTAHCFLHVKESFKSLKEYNLEFQTYFLIFDKIAHLVKIIVD